MRLQDLEEPSSSPDKCIKRIELLREFMPEGAVGAELGVFRGAFIDHLLTTKPSKLYLVDPWFRSASNWPWAKGDNSTVNAVLSIISSFRNEIESGNIDLRLEYSQDFLKSIPDNHLDWVYIDTTHSYKQTLIELELSLKKIKKSGFIMGDDYNSNPQARHTGVYKAVQEMARKDKLELIIDEVHGQFCCRVI